MTLVSFSHSGISSHRTSPWIQYEFVQLFIPLTRIHRFICTVFNTFYKCWHAYLYNFQHLYKYVHAYLYSFEYFCKYLHAYFYIFNTFTNSYMLIWTVFNNVPNIYMLICHPKVALPIAPGGHLSHQPGKCMISYAHLQMQINGSGWFPFGFQCFCMVSMMLSMIYTIVSTCFIGFQDFLLGPPS